MNDRHKVLFLVSWYPTKDNPASGIFIKHHAEAIAKFSDIAILYICPNTSAQDKTCNVKCAKENDTLVIRAYYNLSRNKSLTAKLLNLVRFIRAGNRGFAFLKMKKWHPDILHVNVIHYTGIMGLIWKFLKNKPLIVTEHSTCYLRKTQSLSRAAKFLAHIVTRQAACVTVVSSGLKAAMLKLGLYGNYYVIPNVIKVYDYDAPIYNAKKDNKKRILHVSLLRDSAKDISGLLHVLHKLKKLRTDFELQILGDGADRTKLENLSKELGLYEKYVFFHGLQPHREVIKNMYQADFLVTNSNYETFSVVTAEAIACGVPVIATRCGGPEDFVTEECGVLIEPGNHEQLYSAIIHMLDKHNRYNKKKLQSYAQKNFSFEVIGAAFKEIYDTVSNKQNVKLIKDNNIEKTFSNKS